jgi:hypothetical protein
MDASFRLQNERLVEKKFFKNFSRNGSKMMQIDLLRRQKRVRSRFEVHDWTPLTHHHGDPRPLDCMS